MGRRKRAGNARVDHAIQCAMAAILLCAAPSAHAEIVEVPLPGLLGEYAFSEAATTRATTFQLPRLPDAIHGVSIRILGQQAMGIADCREAGTANLWPMEFVAEMNATPGDAWLGLPPVSYSLRNFEATGEFEPLSETTTWDFLMDGEGEITLTGAPMAELRLCDPVMLPAGELLEVVLIVDGDFSLPVETCTWGRIKALYR